MVDRLIGVCRQRAVGESESLVEVDAGAEGEDARGDACEEAGRGAGAVLFEQELVFERVDDRFDSLPDPADRRNGPVGLIGAAGPEQECVQLADGGFEPGSRKALVADDRRAVDRVGFQQRERRFAFAGVGGDEIEVDDRACRGRRAGRA